MKIGILSMQRVVNNGSYLQAYALRETLKGIGNNEVEFVDFENELIIKDQQEKKKHPLKRALKDVKHTIQPQYRPYMKTVRYGKSFRKKWATALSALGLENELNCCLEKRFDLVVIGSDEVFNLCQFSDGGVDVPWCLLGEGINTKRLVTYAAACGQTNAERIQQIGEEQHCRRLLQRFAALSVRDANTLQTVNTLGGAAALIHIDPVLLAKSFPQEPSYKRLPYKYMLVYAYTRRISNEDEIKAIKSYAKNKGLKTVCVNCFQTWCDIMIACTPFALLQYVRDAECVVTDTFHGAVFSIRENVPFAALVRESNSNKLRFLLRQFGLENREADTAEEIESILRQPIDYDQVNKKLEEERKKAIQYLRGQIESVEDSRIGT